ncbi:MAG: 8-oxo-dGTP pyrophosphatase MutT (NUDIX family) [Candidatus Paceibacteria bacterium]
MNSERAARFARLSRKGKLNRQRQVGALCWRKRGEKLQVLLITSRDSGRWLIPKGWPMDDRASRNVALLEAWEEAGVTGSVQKEAIGSFKYHKGIDEDFSVPCKVAVFSVEVDKIAKHFPEVDQRRQKWFSPKKASRMVVEPQLRKIIRNFEVEDEKGIAKKN